MADDFQMESCVRRVGTVQIARHELLNSNLAELPEADIRGDGPAGDCWHFESDDSGWGRLCSHLRRCASGVLGWSSRFDLETPGDTNQDGSGVDSVRLFAGGDHCIRHHPTGLEDERILRMSMRWTSRWLRSVLVVLVVGVLLAFGVRACRRLGATEYRNS